MLLKKLDSYIQKNESGPFHYSLHKEKLRMDERHQRETGIHQNLRGDTGSNLFNISHSNFFHDASPKAREAKEKNELVGLHQDKKLLHIQGNSPKN